MNGPQRLLETESGSLAEALKQARSQMADDAKLAQIASDLARQGVPLDPNAIPAVAGKWSVGAKVLAGTCGVLVLVTLGALLRPGSIKTATAPPSAAASTAIAPGARAAEPPDQPGRDSRQRPGQTAQAEAEPAERSDEAAPAPEATASAQSASPALAVEHDTAEARPASESRPSSAASLAAQTRSGSAISPAAPAPDSFRAPSSAAGKEDEIALLKDARAALAASPAQALALTERHRADYPRGALVQERELIAITALARLGQSSNAKQRADRFRKAYPRSAYLTQIDRVLAGR